jgi:methionyl-tRNA formyltransferase
MYWKCVRRRRSLWALIDNPYLRVGNRRFESAEDAFEERFFDRVPRDFTGVASVQSFDTVNHRQCVRHVESLAPDALVSFGTGRIREPMLRIPALKLNVHRGVLPRYRGLDSDLWALYFGDFGSIGVTIHTIAPSLDTGDIVRQGRLKLTPGMQPHHIRYHTTVMATDFVTDVVERLALGELPQLVNQDLSQGDYYSFIPVLKRWAALRRFRSHMGSIELQAA